jgi:hypothetical protein
MLVNLHHMLIDLHHILVNLHHMLVNLLHMLVNLLHRLVNLHHYILVDLRHILVDLRHILVDLRHMLVNLRHRLVNLHHYILVDLRHILVDLRHILIDNATTSLSICTIFCIFLNTGKQLNTGANACCRCKPFTSNSVTTGTSAVIILCSVLHDCFEAFELGKHFREQPHHYAITIELAFYR